MKIDQAKDIVIKAGKELVKRGLIARTWGNVSQRIDADTMVITPSGKDYLSLTRDDIVAVNIHTLEYTGPVKPSSEKAVHASCYQNEDVNFVIHTHQPMASAVSACEIDAFDTDSKFAYLGEKVICASYGLPGTKKLNKNVRAALLKSGGNAIIMKKHGAVCFGKSFEDTFETANELEEACRGYLENVLKQKADIKKVSETTAIRYVLDKYRIEAADLQAKVMDVVIENKNILTDQSPAAVALSYLKHPLYPMVDDFAQIVGVKMESVNYNQQTIQNALKRADAVFVRGYGAVCSGLTVFDAEAVKMIVEKNCNAFIAAFIIGRVKPINALESFLMRTVYKMKYSKQI